MPLAGELALSDFFYVSFWEVELGARTGCISNRYSLREWSILFRFREKGGPFLSSLFRFEVSCQARAACRMRWNSCVLGRCAGTKSREGRSTFSGPTSPEFDRRRAHYSALVCLVR